MLSVSIMTSLYFLIGTLIACAFVKEHNSYFANYINGHLVLAAAALLIVLLWLPLMMFWAFTKLKTNKKECIKC